MGSHKDWGMGGRGLGLQDTLENSRRQPRKWATGSKRGVRIRGEARTEEPRDAGREPRRAGVWLVLGRKGGKQGRGGGMGEEGALVLNILALQFADWHWDSPPREKARKTKTQTQKQTKRGRGRGGAQTIFYSMAV